MAAVLRGFLENFSNNCMKYVLCGFLDQAAVLGQFIVEQICLRERMQRPALHKYSEGLTNVDRQGHFPKRIRLKPLWSFRQMGWAEIDTFIADMPSLWTTEFSGFLGRLMRGKVNRLTGIFSGAPPHAICARN